MLITFCAFAELQVTEQLLKSLGVEKCSDLINKRGMLAALFSPVAMESFLSAGQAFSTAMHYAVEDCLSGSAAPCKHSMLCSKTQAGF